MNIAPVSFAGKAELSRFAKEFAPLTQEENKIAKMASKFYDTDVDITSDGVYITSEDADFRNSFIEALKSQSLYKSTFAYNVALDAAKAVYKAADKSSDIRKATGSY